MARLDLVQLRYIASAAVGGMLASGAERAAAGPLQNTGHFSDQLDSLAPLIRFGVGDGNGGKQRLRVGMQRIFAERNSIRPGT